ncbi:hypothetical protein BaRGS_00029152, partial [Batillaria attramentaria]
MEQSLISPPGGIFTRMQFTEMHISDDPGKASEHGDIGSKSKRDLEKRLSDIEDVFTVDTNQPEVNSTVNEPLLSNSPAQAVTFADDETPADDERQEPSAENDDDSGYVLLANQDQDPGRNVVVSLELPTQAGGDNEQREDEISDEDEDDGIEEALEIADKAGPPCLGTPRTRRIWRKLRPIVNEIKEHGVEFLHPVPDEF